MAELDKTKSTELFERAQRVIPGGVNSPVRAFRSVGGRPLFIARGEGSHVFDEDGNAFIDYVCSWGPLILGHAHPAVVSAIQNAAERGTTFGAPTKAEVEMAEAIVEVVPSIEMVRLVSSGTEALMSAVRVARGFTGRSKVIKFEGCYHGHSDAFLSKAGSGVATFGLPDSAGVPQSTVADTITLPYNDLESVKNTLRECGSEVACVVVEPVAGNMGVVAPKPEFLAGLREACDSCGALLIFDEVITGFRVALGGAQELYGIKPDLTTLGKIIGGGLPVGAFGGRRDVMECVAPLGSVYQAGTLSGNPLAVNAGLAMLKIVREDGFYTELERKSALLAAGLADAAKDAGVTVAANRVGSMMTMFFTDGPVCNYADAQRSNVDSYARFFNAMLEHGVYLAPSRFEAAFVSAAHTDDDISHTVESARQVFRALA